MRNRIIFGPRSLADFEQLNEWIALGLSNEKIFSLLKNPLWRSEVVEFRDHLFCAVCDQMLAQQSCWSCGQPVEVRNGK